MNRVMAIAGSGVLLLAMGFAYSAQICRDDISATAPDSRFTDNYDGTVTDADTGLTWKRCAEGQDWDGTTCTGSETLYTWQGALLAADAANFVYSDWRLPNKNELESLIERRCRGPSINALYFPNTPSRSFWSSSPNRFAVGAYKQSWYVSFEHGDTDSWLKTVLHAARLVRTGK